MDQEIRIGLKGEEGGREDIAKEKDRQQGTASRKVTNEVNHRNGGPLLSLPRELRDEIYGYLLASGHLQVLRTSRQLSQEALESLYPKAIFRMYVNSTDGSRNIKPSENVADQIQNIKLQWDLSDHDCSRNAHELIDFCHKQGEMRMTYHVILLFGVRRAALLNANDISALRSSRVFRNVVLETIIKDSTQEIPSGRRAKLRSRILSMFRVLSDELGLTLGPADHRGDVDARHLVFHPPKMLGTRFDELPPSNTAYSW